MQISLSNCLAKVSLEEFPDVVIDLIKLTTQTFSFSLHLRLR
jgi:hypothetical protein